MRLGMWGYPFQIFPLLPNFTLDAAVVPVTLMLVFQWTYKHNKNYYLYALLSAIFFGLVFKPILVS